MPALVKVKMAQTDEVVGALTAAGMRIVGSVSGRVGEGDFVEHQFTVKVPDADDPQIAQEKVREVLRPLGWGEVPIEG